MRKGVSKNISSAATETGQLQDLGNVKAGETNPPSGVKCRP